VLTSRITRRRSAIAVGLAVLCAGTADGWGDRGHEIICTMAWREMQPHTRAVIEPLFGSETHFVRGCTWPDTVRGDPAYDWAKPQHFVNIPPGASFVAARDCPLAGCVGRAIGQQARAAADARLPAEARRDAIEFLAHYVGDIHQPLHVSYAADRGGNAIDVDFCHPRCQLTNLHAVWDNDLVDPVRLGVARRADMLGGTTTGDERRRWRRFGVRRWIAETFALAAQRAYRPVIAGAIAGGTIADQPPPIRLDAAYVDAMRPTVDEQLRKAAVRLAAVLDAIAAGTVPQGLTSVPVYRARPTAPAALAVRRTTDPRSARVGTLAAGSDAEVIGVLGDQLRLRLADGTEGYVPRAPLSVLE
jgi:hypothetical protein